MLSPDALASFLIGDEAFARREYPEAARAYRQALAEASPFPEASTNLGNALMMTGAFAEALAAYEQAGTPAGWINASVAARAMGEPDRARALLDRAIRLEPGNALAHANLGNLLKDLGRVDLALASYRAALALDPSNATTHANLVYMTAFAPGATPSDLLGEAKAWERLHAQGPGLAKVPNPPLAPRAPGSRLRIGYVSPDFREHCQAMFTLPLFEHHDREAFELFAYSSVLRPDAFTARLRGHCDVWRDCAGLDDAAVAGLIRQDGIDVLVDLTMYMANGRPRLFAQKPAPTQVAWLAYPGTTGLSAMDYRLTDPWLDPPGADDAYAETSFRLPHTFWCYAPLTENSPPGPLPALTQGQVTFGCLNHFCKVNPAVLALWNRVLEAVPGSRLRLLAHPGDHRRWVRDHLRDPSRVDFIPFLPRQDYLEQYRHLDLCLDTFPYNGHTTSLDAFWMGVPVVTRVGPTVVGRAGWSQLNNLGLPELAAWTDDAFVRIAADLARNLPRLASLRAGLRARMEASPLMDAALFTRNLEAAYQCMVAASSPG